MAKILVVEDEPSLNEVYKAILEHDKHEVATVFDGEEALGKVKEFKPDIILLDILMPKMDGLEFLRQYAPDKKPKARVIILSNVSQDKEVLEGLELGAYKYIVKADTSPKQLTEFIQRMVASLELEQAA